MSGSYTVHRWLNKERVLTAIFSLWTILWLFFLIREDKDGQYKTYFKLLTSRGEEKKQVIYGRDLIGFSEFCKDMIPAGQTYEIMGLGDYDVDKVRLRYLLWPARAEDGDTDFKITVDPGIKDVEGYVRLVHDGSKGNIFIKKDRL